jgi:hypothetical protein
MPQVTIALELFGVDLESSKRDEVRSAVEQAGLVLIREAGEEEWYDIYDSSAVVDGSSRLFLGFVKADQSFAFAEYEFKGTDATQLAQALVSKYGDAETQTGRYMSDRRYRWQREGIEIKLSSDWQNYRIRLSYIEFNNLAKLQAEQSEKSASNEETAEYSVF